MEVTAEQVEQAVTQFYANSSGGKTELNTWLTQLQHSNEAWNFAWTLLDKNKPQQVQFFAGNTVYVKVSRHWHQVPKEEYDSLKIKLLNLIAEFSDSRVVLNRLLKALGAYIIQTIENDWPTALEDIISMFNPDTVSGIEPSTALDLLFSILMIIPDELDNCQETMGVRNQNKQCIRILLKNNSKGVLNLILQVMQSNQVGNVTKEIVLRTLNAWLRLSLPLTDTRELLVALIPYSKYGLLCEWVLECLRTAITDMNLYSLSTTVMEFITQMLSLKPVLDEALQCDDENTASLIYSLFTSVVETHSRLLLQSSLEETHKQAVIQVVTLLVDCSSTPGQYPTEETLSSIPFAVWYTIQDDILSFEDDQQTELLHLFKPVYLKLVDTFIKKSLLPPDTSLSGEEKEMFRCYRQDICDTYMYAYYVLKGDMLNHLEEHLKNGVVRIQNDPNDWRYLEAVLHAYSSVAETVAESDNYYVPRFIQSIPQIPFSDNVQLISVALTTLGAYADWLNYHNEHLHHVVPLMVAGLVNNSLVGAASQALRDLTLECPITIAPFSQPILHSCQKALEQTHRVDSAECERIMTIISRVLSVGRDSTSVMNYLNAILTPYITRITILKDNMEKFDSTDQLTELVSLLKLLCCVARHLNRNNYPSEEGTSEADKRLNSQCITAHEPQPLLIVLQPLMPILAEIATKGANEPNVIEALCKLLKNSISTLMEHSIHILPSILEIIPPLYETSLNAAVLDLVKQVTVLFGFDTSQERNMAMLLQLVVATTLTRATQDLWVHTDVVQGSLSLVVASVKKTPHLLNTQQLAPLFSFGMAALELPEEGSVRDAGSFLSAFIVYSREVNGSHFQSIVSHNIERLVRTVVLSICISPRHSLGSFSEILSSLCKLYGDDLVRTFKTIQADSSFPSPRITAQQKGDFAKRVMKNRGHKRNILDAVTDLALISRGLAGTEYAAQTRGYP